MLRTIVENCRNVARKRPSAAAHTVKSCRQQSSEVLKHPSYGTDLAPFDCLMFGPFKEAFRGGHFASDQVKEAVREWLVTNTQSF